MLVVLAVAIVARYAMQLDVFFPYLPQAVANERRLILLDEQLRVRQRPQNSVDRFRFQAGSSHDQIYRDDLTRLEIGEELPEKIPLLGGRDVSLLSGSHARRAARRVPRAELNGFNRLARDGRAAG